MPSTISVDYKSHISVTETFTGDYVEDDNSTAGFDGLNETMTLNASSSVPVTKQASFQQAMTSGSATISLQALPGLTDDETVVGTGLKVQLLKFRSLSTNANKITVAKGGSSGYGLCASGDSWSVVLSPGQSVTFYLDEDAPDIANGAKNIDLTGTLSQVLECFVVMG